MIEQSRVEDELHHTFARPLQLVLPYRPGFAVHKCSQLHNTMQNIEFCPQCVLLKTLVPCNIAREGR